MKEAAKLRVKRKVIEISDDEVESGLPLKVVKCEEVKESPPVPSPSPPLSLIVPSPLPPLPSPSPLPDVAELQRKLEKSERMFQKAVRAAREAELRAEEAETLLDCKNGILVGAATEGSEVAELEKKLTMVTEQLRAAKAETESTVKKAIELSQLNRNLKEDFKKSNWHEQEAKKKALEITKENLALKEELKGLRNTKKIGNAANSTVNSNSAELAEKCAKLDGIIQQMRKQNKLNKQTRTKVMRENMRLKDDLKLMKGYEELGKAANEKSSQLDRDILALKEELEKMRGKETQMDSELKEARVALFCKNNIEKENQSFKEQLKQSRGKEDEAARKIAELELQKLGLQEYQQALLEGAAKLVEGDNARDLTVQNFLLKEESMATKRREETACKISLELSRENSILKQELGRLRGANGRCEQFRMADPMDASAASLAVSSRRGDRQSIPSQPVQFPFGESEGFNGCLDHRPNCPWTSSRSVQYAI